MRKKREKEKRMKRKRKKRKEKIGYYRHFTIFNYHKESFNQTFHQNSFISIAGVARGAEIKKATSLVIFLID
jgi:hypothetical protein